ncbi:hypothetical protein MJG53_007844 [Ovis ammon polii x Ovis aries]|uniref:Uncharacterized protein n=1 Tax=Ovis ammon polii x Ovis aries TaxID=2918886 RepID=A0ACB9V571_9CETA|nr:hypothetical protein MJG53_007844 [Ovis ammon polii x Ovis aries]
MFLLIEYKGRLSRAEEAGREGDREKEKRTWKETERVQEAARSERQGTGGSPRLDALLSGPAALGPRTGSLGRQKPEPAHLCRTRYKLLFTRELWQENGCIRKSIFTVENQLEPRLC